MAHDLTPTRLVPYFPDSCSMHPRRFILAFSGFTLLLTYAHKELLQAIKEVESVDILYKQRLLIK
jgi:hypothetical protein